MSQCRRANEIRRGQHDESRSATANQSEFKRNFTRVPLDRPRPPHDVRPRKNNSIIWYPRTAPARESRALGFELNGQRFFVRNSRRTHVPRNTYEGFDNQSRGIKIIVFNKRQHWTVHARYRGTYIDVCRNEYFPRVFFRGIQNAFSESCPKNVVHVNRLVKYYTLNREKKNDHFATKCLRRPKETAKSPSALCFTTAQGV